MSTQRQGEWSFEIKQIFCRKTPEHGEKYCASAVITVTDGEPHIELMLNKSTDHFSRQDYRDIRGYLTSLGFKRAKITRFNSAGSKVITLE